MKIMENDHSYKYFKLIKTPNSVGIVPESVLLYKRLFNIYIGYLFTFFQKKKKN